MNINFPNGEPILSERSQLSVIQRLPAGRAPRLAIGSAVERGQPLNESGAGATAVTLAIAERLGAAPNEAEKLLNRPVGSRFSSGEEIARARKGLRPQSVVAPFTGVLQTYNHATGLGLFAAANGQLSNALVSGEVELVENDSISIKTSGSRVFGIVGFGATATGPLRVLATDPGQSIPPSRIGEDARGAIVVAGGWLSAAAYKRMIEAGAAGVISGGFVETEIASAFNLSPDARIGSWRETGGRISAHLAVVATEGFGELPINDATWRFLKSVAGQEATVIPETRIGDYLARPQILILGGAAGPSSASAPATIVPGSSIRIVDQAGLGTFAVTASSVMKSRSANGVLIDVVDVRLANGKTQAVRACNLELIA